ncbi:MAG: TonB-dependent receptor [Sphingomonadales bacterium]|nr:TonB-dependent receptor [Sphingomonadales bacterium]
MKNTRISKFKYTAAPLAMTLALITSPVYAQDATADETTTAEEEAIVVTGSRIQNPNLELSSPVGVVTSEELSLRQTNTAETFLRELPGAVPSIGSAVNNGNGGSSFVDLRGLGENRNLVLLDGRRVVPADSQGVVDLNIIPLAVIERTDILTGGATTTYGADAITGVVNFVTKRDFAGLEAEISNGIIERGDGNQFRADVTIGANFDDGRGNVVLSIGYQEQDTVFQGDRDFSEFNIGSFTGAPGGSSNSVPANIRGPLTGQITEDGSSIGPFDRPFNFNPFNIFQTPFERFNVFSSARYEVSDAVEVYTQAMFSKQTVSTKIAPGGSFFDTYTFNYNSPFINDTIGNAICAGDGVLTAAQCTAALNTPFGPTLADGSVNPDYQTFDASVRRRTVETGTRDSAYTTQLFNVTAGLRGDISENLSWDISAGYGESERIERQSGYGRLSRIQQAILNLPDGSCVDDSNGCVPLNLFGIAGSITPEQIAFSFGQTQQVINTTTLATANGTLSGDLGFGFGDDPIAFAVGGEFRKYTATRLSDEASQTPGAVVGGGGAAPDISGGYNVYDAFGEVSIPLFSIATIDLGARYSDYSTSGGEFTWKAGGTLTPVDWFTVRGNYQRSTRAPNVGELFTPVATQLENFGFDPCQGSAPVGNAQLQAVCLAQGAPLSSIGAIEPPVAGQVNVTTGGNQNLGVEKATTWTIGALFEPEFIPGFSMTVDYFNIAIKDAITNPTPGDAIGICFNNLSAASATDPECTRIRRNPLDGGLSGSPADTPGLDLPLTNRGFLATDGIDLSLRYKTDLTDTIGLSLAFDGTWTNKNIFRSIPGGVNRDCVGFYSVNCESIQPEFGFTQRTSLDFGDDFRLSLLWRYIDAVQYEPLQFAEDVAAAERGNRDVNGALLPEDDQACPDFNGDDDGGCLVEPDFRNIGAKHYFDLTGQWNITDAVTFTLTVRNLFDSLPKNVGSDLGSTSFNSGNVYPSTYDALGRRYAASVKFRF